MLSCKLQFSLNFSRLISLCWLNHIFCSEKSSKYLSHLAGNFINKLTISFLWGSVHWWIVYISACILITDIYLFTSWICLCKCHSIWMQGFRKWPCPSHGTQAIFSLVVTCNVRSTVRRIYMQISKLDTTKLEFHIKDWEVSPYKSKHLCMAIFWNNTQQT